MEQAMTLKLPKKNTIIRQIDKYINKLKTEDLDESSDKGNKKRYWIEVKFSNDDPAYDAINGLDNFSAYSTIFNKFLGCFISLSV